MAGLVICSPYISSGARHAPLTGWLIGENTRIQTIVRSFTSSWSYKLFGGTTSYSRTTTDSYSIGNYRMSDGTVQQARCDTYRLI